VARSSERAGGRRPRLAGAAAALAALVACSALAPPRGTPSGRPGWLVYALGGLGVEAPAAWAASGDARRLTLQAPDGRAWLEVTVPEMAYADERACLAAAEERVAGGATSLERARRHPTRLAGRPAQALEGDRGAWHVWALAACDGGAQYRIFFTAATPASQEALEVWRTLLQGARIGGQARGAGPARSVTAALRPGAPAA
jgi:hypothetical protein